MLIRNVTREDLDRALARANLLFDDNLTFNRCDEVGTRVHHFVVTLRVKSSRGLGHRRAVTMPWHTREPARLIAACWHAHGLFIGSLPEAAVVEAVVGMVEKHRVTPADEWIDVMIGPPICPTAASEACDCSGPLARRAYHFGHEAREAEVAW